MTEDEIRERTRALVAEVGVDATQFDFRSAQWDAGLAKVQYPEGKGGLGLSPKLQTVVEQELRDAGVPWDSMVINPIASVWDCPPS